MLQRVSTQLILKRGIDKAVTALVVEIKTLSRPTATNKEIAQVGSISANSDQDIGDIIAKAMDKVGKEGVITVEDGKSLENELDIVEGMQFDRGYLSPYFINNPENKRLFWKTHSSCCSTRRFPTSVICSLYWNKLRSLAVHC